MTIGTLTAAELTAILNAFSDLLAAESAAAEHLTQAERAHAAAQQHYVACQSTLENAQQTLETVRRDLDEAEAKLRSIGLTRNHADVLWQRVQATILDTINEIKDDVGGQITRVATTSPTTPVVASRDGPAERPRPPAMSPTSLRRTEDENFEDGLPVSEGPLDEPRTARTATARRNVLSEPYVVSDDETLETSSKGGTVVRMTQGLTPPPEGEKVTDIHTYMPNGTPKPRRPDTGKAAEPDEDDDLDQAPGLLEAGSMQGMMEKLRG